MTRKQAEQRGWTFSHVNEGGVEDVDHARTGRVLLSLPSFAAALSTGGTRFELEAETEAELLAKVTSWEEAQAQRV